MRARSCVESGRAIIASTAATIPCVRRAVRSSRAPWRRGQDDARTTCLSEKLRQHRFRHAGEPSARASAIIWRRPSSPSGVSACALVSARIIPLNRSGAQPEQGEGDVAAHRQSADDRRIDREFVEQRGDIGGHVVERDRAPDRQRRQVRIRACPAQ